MQKERIIKSIIKRVKSQMLYLFVVKREANAEADRERGEKGEK